MPAVSTRSNCKCLANSLDQTRERLSDGDLQIYFHLNRRIDKIGPIPQTNKQTYSFYAVCCDGDCCCDYANRCRCFGVSQPSCSSSPMLAERHCHRSVQLVFVVPHAIDDWSQPVLLLNPTTFDDRKNYALYCYRYPNRSHFDDASIVAVDAFDANCAILWIVHFHCRKSFVLCVYAYMDVLFY